VIQTHYLAIKKYSDYKRHHTFSGYNFGKKSVAYIHGNILSGMEILKNENRSVKWLDVIKYAIL
jgi:hypothetical protein